ncbi:MAG: flagellar biosynthesis protein FlhB [Peptococcaceae bacterium]|nr:flagellar biosynthesis protein FlhB [Peptococcaceae bacterium]
MSGEKTHSATPRRRSEARNKGQVLKSAELSSAILFVVITAVLKFWLPTLVNNVGNYSVHVFSATPVADYSFAYAQGVILQTFMLVVEGIAPVAVSAFVVSMVVNYLQVGNLFSVQVITPDFQKINPIGGLQKFFSLRSLVELAKSLIKLSIMSYLLYSTLYSQILPQLPVFEGANLAVSLAIFSQILVGIVWKIAIFFLLLGIADYFYQWWNYEKSLKMSKQELKDDFKSSEGDPLVRNAIKRKQRAMSMQRMMQDVPKADVIVTNPTHFAVAIRYEAAMGDAPIVLAKGQDEVALRIKSIAIEHNVPTVENPPLARSLFRNVEIGQPVPPELYKAVAEVLAFVYRLNRKRSS